MKRVLIYLDPHTAGASVDLLEAAYQMYGRTGCQAFGLGVGAPADAAVGSFDTLLMVDDARVAWYDLANITTCIQEVHAQYAFDAILVPATPFGRMLAPRVAMRLHVGLVADVTEIRHRNGRLQLVRPAFSGRMLAAVVNQGPAPVMLSVRPHTFTYAAGRRRQTAVLSVRPAGLRDSRIRLVDTRSKPDAVDIRESDVLVSGGGGVLRHFDRLAELAEALGGQVSASRKVVDSGAAPRHIQVGQSGKTVSPRLYIALGISGSIQHVVGLKNAETIIAVNSNRHAPICALSDIVVEGDAREFTDRLLARIKRDGWRSPDPEKKQRLDGGNG